MAKYITSAVLLVIAALLVGGLLTYWLIPREVIKTNTITITKEVPVEKLVNVEVVKEVTPNYKQQVVDKLLSEAKSDKDFRTCSGEKYDIEEIQVKKVYDGFTLTENSDGDLEISDVKVKLNYDDGDCYRTLTCGLNADKELDC